MPFIELNKTDRAAIFPYTNGKIFHQISKTFH